MAMGRTDLFVKAVHYLWIDLISKKIQQDLAANSFSTVYFR